MNSAILFAILFSSFVYVYNYFFLKKKIIYSLFEFILRRYPTSQKSISERGYIAQKGVIQKESFVSQFIR